MVKGSCDHAQRALLDDTSCARTSTDGVGLHRRDNVVDGVTMSSLNLLPDPLVPERPQDRNAFRWRERHIECVDSTSACSLRGRPLNLTDAGSALGLRKAVRKLVDE